MSLISALYIQLLLVLCCAALAAPAAAVARGKTDSHHADGNE